MSELWLDPSFWPHLTRKEPGACLPNTVSNSKLLDLFGHRQDSVSVQFGNQEENLGLGLCRWAFCNTSSVRNLSKISEIAPTFSSNQSKHLQYGFQASQVLGRQATVAGHPQDGPSRRVLFQADGRGCFRAHARR